MNAVDSGILPPHSVEAEQACLGGLMLDNNAYDRVVDLLREGDFFRTDHRLIWRHIVRLIESGRAADLLTVFESLQSERQDDDAGGLSYLHAITQNTPSAAGISTYAEIVVERAKKRALMQAAAVVTQDVSGRKSAEEIAADCEQALIAAVDRAVGDPVSMASAMTEACDFIEERQAGRRGLMMGFKQLDALLAGMEGGQLLLGAGRPSMGKTVLGVNVADNVASEGKSVLFFSLEMPKREIALRLMASRASVPMHAMRSGGMKPSDFSALADVREGMSEQRLFIDDKPAVSVAYVRARARRIKRRHGLDLMVIDYLGLMTGIGDNRVQEVGSISRGLKALAKELAVPILLLAQLNRASEGRNDKRPVLSDLRDSGEVEQDADAVLMLHREAVHTDDPEWQGIAEVLVRKNRNGPLGTAVLAFDGACMRFDNTERRLPVATVAPLHRKGLR